MNLHPIFPDQYLEIAQSKRVCSSKSFKCAPVLGKGSCLYCGSLYSQVKAGAGESFCFLATELLNASPILDTNLSSMVHRFNPVLGLRSGGRFLVHFRSLHWMSICKVVYFCCIMWENGTLKWFWARLWWAIGECLWRLLLVITNQKATIWTPIWLLLLLSLTGSHDDPMLWLWQATDTTTLSSLTL